jgi:predicted ABC-type ATPase
LSAAKPIFHLLAGPNGAGKSTLYRALVASGSISSQLEFVNADLYEQSHLQHITIRNNVQKPHATGPTAGAKRC